MNRLRLSMGPWFVVVVVLLVLWSDSGSRNGGVAALAFRLPSWPPLGRLLGGGEKPSSGIAERTTTTRIRHELRQAMAGTNRGKTATVAQQQTILRLVRQLEVTCPAPLQLLTDPEMARQYLNGTWYLQYTSPSQIEENANIDDTDEQSPTTSTSDWTPQFATEGDANIPTTPFVARGTVTAAGVTIDTSTGQVQQSIDTSTKRVENIVVNNAWLIRAAGTFRPSQTVPTRAVVSFDTLQLQLLPFTIDLGWIFAVIGTFRNSRENGWLETTYVDEQWRIGRGNKGTLFILTRDPDGAAMLEQQEQ